MKKGIFITLALCLMVAAAHSQQPFSNGIKDFTYEFKQDAGTNASTVVWVAPMQMYVTAIAGNAVYPMEGFNAKGKSIFAVEAGMDVRGMWFNPANGNIEVNCAGDMGWKSFSITSSKVPSSSTDLFEGQNQPDFQSVGAYDFSKKTVVFFDMASGGLALYSRRKPSKIKRLALDWGAQSAETINMYSVGFTGHAGYEYVLLDYDSGKLVYFNRKGKLTGTTRMPADAPLNEAFAFSFANDRVFLYDKDARIWTAYKVF